MSRLKDAIPLEKLASRQVRLWEQTVDKPGVGKTEAVRPCITISKEPGSCGVELAHRISKRLGWHVFDRDLVESIAKQADVRAEMVELFDQKTQDDIHNWVVTLLDRFALGTDEYFKHLVTVITTIGRHGHAVVLGRGSSFILSSDKTLRIRVVASFEHRAQVVAEQMRITRREAGKVVDQQDAERAAFIQRYFHHSVTEPENYDLMLNTGTISLEVAESITIHALQSKFAKIIPPDSLVHVAQ